MKIIVNTSLHENFYSNSVYIRIKIVLFKREYIAVIFFIPQWLYRIVFFKDWKERCKRWK